ncbi:hypothetical protein AC578_2253 [Pseudocercospora eumusae]|uniref:Uncharacterized protein n=1 Tax=Pseudocercospora eumusae TaxID=321146 RepID=A0A139GTC5_9PEZI|nr:hypothetical protein AC578_2253 [Pseudocercospora eumusae]
MSATPAIINTDVFNFEMVRQAISLLVEKSEGRMTEGATEDYVARYANNFIRQIFTVRNWSIVPQYFSQSGKFPDLVLETWTKNKDGKTVFVPKIFIEFKSTVGDTVSKALKQAQDAVAKEYGGHYRNKGYLIVVAGYKWLFMEYQFVLDTPSHDTRGRASKEVVLQTWPLDFPGFPEVKGKPSRPIELPTQPQLNGDGFELNVNKPVEFDYIKDLLVWLSETKGKLSRTFHKEQDLERLSPEYSSSVLASESSKTNLMRNMSAVWDSDEVDYIAKLLLLAYGKE